MVLRVKRLGEGGYSPTFWWGGRGRFFFQKADEESTEKIPKGQQVPAERGIISWLDPHWAAEPTGPHSSQHRSQAWRDYPQDEGNAFSEKWPLYHVCFYSLLNLGMKEGSLNICSHVRRSQKEATSARFDGTVL